MFSAHWHGLVWRREAGGQASEDQLSSRAVPDAPCVALLRGMALQRVGWLSAARGGLEGLGVTLR